MVEAITLMAAFVVFLSIALVLALGQRRNGARPSAKVQLDKRTGDYFWVDADGRRYTLEEYRALLNNRDT